MAVSYLTDTTTTEIYTPSLPTLFRSDRRRRLRRRGGTIDRRDERRPAPGTDLRLARPRQDRLPQPRRPDVRGPLRHGGRDRKSTRLNSSHSQISYAVFCLKKKI